MIDKKAKSKNDIVWRHIVTFNEHIRTFIFLTNKICIYIL